MDIFGDFTTLLTLAIAVFIFLRLRSVLGKRTGHQRPPFDPEELKNNRSANDMPGNDNIVTLPNRDGKGASASSEAAEGAAIDAIAKPGSKLNDQLKKLAASDPSFNPEEFLGGARLAYEMIVTAFADGDRKTLKNLLSREVYDGFVTAIAERESRGETVQSNFVGIDNAEISEAILADKTATLTVTFTSQMVTATLAADGSVFW